MTYTAISVIGMDIYVVADRIVSQLRLRCCRMVVTIYQGLMKVFPQTWQHHRLMIASTVESRVRESGQGDKWSFCLTAGKIGPRIRREHEQETAPEPHIGL